jgi:replicative DNA helicase
VAAKALPYNREAEEAVLGSCLQDVEAVAEVVEILQADDFYVKNHSIIFTAMLELFHEGSGADLTLVGEELLKRGQLERIGGALEIARLVERVPSSANVLYHTRIVIDKALQRRLISAANEILERTRSGSSSVGELVDQAESMIFEVAHRSVGGDVATLGEMVHEILRAVDSRRDGETVGLQTCYPDLDDKLGGLHGGQLIILAARPSMGKTTFALNIALRAACNEEARAPVGIFSLEMTRQQLAQNLLCCHSRVDAHLLRKGTLSSDEYERLGHSGHELSSIPIYIDDTPGINSLQLRAKARRLKSMHDIGLVVVDYLQLVQGPNTENRQQEISQISMGLKRLARELEVPVIAISQLNRSVDAREDHRPRMSDLRESGSLEQDADIVLFLYREDYYDQGRNPSTQNKAQLIVAKHRNGPVGEVDLTFFPDQLRFEPYSDLDFRE